MIGDALRTAGRAPAAETAIVGPGGARGHPRTGVAASLIGPDQCSGAQPTRSSNCRERCTTSAAASASYEGSELSVNRCRSPG